MLKILPEPLFTVSVAVPVPGGADTHIACTFRYLDSEAFADWLTASAKGGDGKVYERDADAVIKILAAWDGVEAELTRDNLVLLFRARPALAQSMVNAYSKELLKAPAKN